MRPGGTSATPDRLDRPFHDPLFDRLFPPAPSGVHWGLERVEAALADLGNPHLDLPTVHVGGTNGKGSVASTVANVLTAGGLRVGLYTSPHLCSIRERFMIGGRPVEEGRLIEVADRVRPAVVEHGLTFFEAATVLAFELFAEEGVDAQIIEVGLGGRLDATNVVRPTVTALTNVALDHAEFLGDTLAEIAAEKAGILKAGVPAVTAETGKDALAVFRQRAREVGARLTEVDPGWLAELEVEEDHTAFTMETTVWGRLRVRTPLVGQHQAANAALAVLALERLPGALRPSREVLLEGVSTVRWPGRDQIEHLPDGDWILDVAHNTAGVESLVAVLDRLDLPAPHVALVGVLGDKTWEEMLPPLMDRVDATILTQPPSAPESRRWNPEVVAVRVAERRPEAKLEVVEDFGAALRRARMRAGQGTVVVTGSCHTVGDALRELGRVPFEEPPR